MAASHQREEAVLGAALGDSLAALRPGLFMSNDAGEWSPSIRDDGKVITSVPDALEVPIAPRHRGRRDRGPYHARRWAHPTRWLLGPEWLAQDRVTVLTEVLKRPITIVEVSAEEQVALLARQWLVVYGRRKWETYYSAEALELQRRFLDHFLKGASVGCADEPAVRYELRHTRTRYTVRTTTHWQLPHATLRTLYLDAASMTLLVGADPERQGQAARDLGVFVESVGESDPIRLSPLWYSGVRGCLGEGVWLWDHLDVFVVVRKHNPAGAVVPFYGYNGYAEDGVAKGWLRGSQRELDATRSRPERPFPAHRTVEPVEPGEPTQMTVEIWPSSTHFEANSELVVEIVGHDADRYPVLRHKATVNRGTHTIHTGGATPSALIAPLVSATKEVDKND